MFERGINNSGNNDHYISVRLTLMDETVTKGAVVSNSRTLRGLLNNPDNFIEFTDMHGETEFIAKSRIASAKEITEIKTDQLDKVTDNLEVMNPYQVLDISSDATEEEIHAAYRSKARSYHPDRLSAFKLPSEVMKYAETMQLQLNRAYEELKPRPEQERPFVNKPVYEKMPAGKVSVG